MDYRVQVTVALAAISLGLAYCPAQAAAEGETQEFAAGADPNRRQILFAALDAKAGRGRHRQRSGWHFRSQQSRFRAKAACRGPAAAATAKTPRFPVFAKP